MIRGETVEVWAYIDAGRDALNNPVRSWQVEATVGNVLVAPSSTTDVTGSTRPDADASNIILHFPKTYQASLRGRRVKVRGVEYVIEGDPIAYTSANTPGMWNRPATATRVEG